jgi:MFS family permease
MYKALGITGNQNLLVSGIYNCVGPLASKSSTTTLFSLYTVLTVKDLIFITFFLDRVGRRRPLMMGTIGITIALVCEAIVNSQNPDGTKRGLSIAGVFFIFCVTVIFSCSFGKSPLSS